MFDENDVRISGVVLSVDGGLDEKKGPYANLYLDSKGYKYSETLHILFYGETATKIQADVVKGDRVFIRAKLLGKKFIDSISMKLVGNHYLKIKD
jgi:hypothetical protein